LEPAAALYQAAATITLRVLMTWPVEGIDHGVGWPGVQPPARDVPPVTALVRMDEVRQRSATFPATES
jgi:hypothetical protein